MISSLLPVVIHHETNADKSAEALENIYYLEFMRIGTNVKHKAPYEGWWDVWSEAMVSFPLVARTSEATRLLFTASILVRFGRHSWQLGNLTRHFFSIVYHLLPQPYIFFKISSICVARTFENSCWQSPFRWSRGHLLKRGIFRFLSFHSILFLRLHTSSTIVKNHPLSMLPG